MSEQVAENARDHEAHDRVGPSTLSAEALLELEELTAGVRDDAPALNALVDYLRTPENTSKFEGRESISMLEDARSYTVFRDAVGIKNFQKAVNLNEVRNIINLYLEELKEGVKRKDRSLVNEAKRFCMVFAEGLIARQMRDVSERMERSDSRYVGRNAVL